MFFAKDKGQQQINNIAFITFWSQFSAFAINTIFILFLTRPLLEQGLGYSQAKAYAFIGITQATGYLMPILGGYMADRVLGIRRAILLGGLLLALAYLLLMLSGYTLSAYGDTLFLIAYAMIPVSNSFLMGTASALVSIIYKDDSIKAKSAMTFYYMAINIGGLLAVFIAPSLLESPYGPLSVFALSFIGKAIAALNFLKKYKLYDNVLIGKDKENLTLKSLLYCFIYFISIYLFTLFAYFNINIASFIISAGCVAGILWFFIKTLRLSGESRTKQLLSILLIVEAVIFFVIYNQMNSTLVIFAKSNSNLHLLGLSLSPAQFQIINPILIIVLGTQLPKFYQRFPKFTIPFQFACGTILAGIGLLILAIAAFSSTTGYVNGNYLGLTYVFITLAELWVSAIGLSMIGLYCDSNNLGFAMGVWYLACSLSNTISGRIAAFASMPSESLPALARLLIYQNYYFYSGIIALILGVIMYGVAKWLHVRFEERGLVLA